MNISPRTLRLALLTVLLGASSVARASDGSGRALPSGSDRWRLRPADVLVTGATDPAPAKGSPAAEIPEERRAVRVVYPGLLGQR